MEIRAHQIQNLNDDGVPNRIEHLISRLAIGNKLLCPQHREMLRDIGLLHGKLLYQCPGGEFATVKCNRREVDLEPVTDPKDIETLLHLISRHSEYTGSPQAKWILDNWEATLPKFVKVFPHEYKRVLGIPRVPAGVLLGAPAASHMKTGQVIHG